MYFSKNLLYFLMRNVINKHVLGTNVAVFSPQKNLTGLPRVVKDITADIFNTIQKWNQSYLLGCDIVNNIANIKEGIKGFSEEIDKLLEQLFGVVENMRAHSKIISSCVTKLGAVSRLNQENSVLFSTATVTDISSLINDISSAYESELKVKVFVLENMGYAKDKNKVWYFVTAWTCEKYINDEINAKLEALLTETGHRNIV